MQSDSDPESEAFRSAGSGSSGEDVELEDAEPVAAAGDDEDLEDADVGPAGEASHEEEQEEDEEEQSDTEESDEPGSPFYVVHSFARTFTSNSRQLDQFQRLPVDIPPLQGDLAQQLYLKLLPQQHTKRPSVMDSPPTSPTTAATTAPSPPSPPPDRTPMRRITRAAARAARGAAGPSPSAVPAQAPAGPSAAAVQLSPTATYSVPTVNLHSVLAGREAPARHCRKPARSEQLHISSRYIPRHFKKQVDSMYSKAYIGQYSADGSFFVAAFQDRRIRIYDADNSYRLRKDLRAPNLYWTITDTSLSADRSLLLYSTISPIVYVAKVGSAADPVASISNVTDIHDELCFNNSHMDQRHPLRRALARHHDFGVWSIQWGPSRPEVIAGTNDRAAFVYDLEAQCVQVRVETHDDDVNAVAYLDDTGQVVVTGSDDATIQLWDRRIMSSRDQAKPQGVLLGHREGITHVDPKGDGRYLISNSKDQTTKLWDVRRALPYPNVRHQPLFYWDYRSDRYPGDGFAITHPDDCSLMTYRGHRVLKTLIRAYWSPEHTTGQRYIYTGSADGVMRVYDVLTGKVVSELCHHDKPVRDCSWHPTRAELMSVAWDGTVALWGAGAETAAD